MFQAVIDIILHKICFAKTYCAQHLCVGASSGKTKNFSNKAQADTNFCVLIVAVLCVLQWKNFGNLYKAIDNLTQKFYTICVIGVSPSGKATDSDSVIRRFKSCYPSHRATSLIVATERKHSSVLPFPLLPFGSLPLSCV